MSVPTLFEGNIFNRMFSLLDPRSDDLWSTDPYDVYSDSSGNTIIEFAVVGANKEDIKVSTSGQTLKVEYNSESKPEDKDFYHKKISRRNLKKAFSLSEAVDKSKIEAEYKNGLLKITVPINKEEKKDTQIKIK